MKRRKWDVAAAPEPAPGSLAAQAAAAAEAALAAAAAPGHFAASRAGIGAGGLGSGQAAPAAAPSAGVQVVMPAQPAPKVELPADYQPGKPLDEETKRKIQASAAAVVQRLNQVRLRVASRACGCRAGR